MDGGGEAHNLAPTQAVTVVVDPEGRAWPADSVIRGTRLSAADRRRLWDAVVELSGGPDPVPAA